MSDNNNNNSANQNGSSQKRKADGTGPSPRGKKLTNDLLATLENPDLCDVTLIGSDGGRVPAIRVYLSARSEVFQHLLVGQFKEASEEEVHMDYPSPVLKALVHYCCTDDVAALDALDSDLLERMNLAAKLCAAADYYGLDPLKEKTFEEIKKTIQETKEDERGACICLLFEVFMHLPSLKHFLGTVLVWIWGQPSTCLLVGNRPGVAFLSATSLLALSHKERFHPFAWILFCAIKLWMAQEESPGLALEDRRLQVAKKCASMLELRMISPTDLVGPVSESGLVDPSRILQTLQVQSKGGFIALCGAGIPGGNGIYEEVAHINQGFEAVEEGDPSRYSTRKRFDKRGLLNETEVTFSVLSFEAISGRRVWAVMAPPEGAGSILASEGVKLYQNNRCLYQSTTGMTNDGMKFCVPGGADEISGGTRPPKMLSGKTLFQC